MNIPFCDYKSSALYLERRDDLELHGGRGEHARRGVDPGHRRHLKVRLESDSFSLVNKVLALSGGYCTWRSMPPIPSMVEAAVLDVDFNLYKLKGCDVCFCSG